MSTPTSPSYHTQVISKRYIKNAVLENYVNGKLAEFGSDWTYEAPRDNKIKFTALRDLTEDELKHIQKTSFPDRFENDFV